MQIVPAVPESMEQETELLAHVAHGTGSSCFVFYSSCYLFSGHLIRKTISF